MISSNLVFENNPFDILTSDPSIFTLEGYGRRVGILVDPKENSVPIVRTTTVYDKPPTRFTDVHRQLIEKIKEECFHIGIQEKVDFNNAMIEMYTSEYINMKPHSDQALDLMKNSFICLFSCYNRPKTKEIRELEVTNKRTGEKNNIQLRHGSIVVFSTEANQAHVHRIILDPRKVNKKNPKTTLWLGLTFRMSGTFVDIVDGVPILSTNGEPLRLANEEEKRNFFHLKGDENKRTDMTYPPDINFTISPSDMMPVK